MSKIPDRWIPYKACGYLVEGTRFICFKVPLSKSVQIGKRDIKEIWDIPALLNKIPNLGAVIDLTNTNRYYNPSELTSAGVVHRKILMPGRILPPESTVKEFVNAVDEFLDKDFDFLIGVHCTHGLNRTGYMVCRYMRDRLGIPAKEAIKRFENARGYKIERENYIANLLDKPPLPADVGKNTVVKPIDKRKNSMTYTSPLQEYDEDEVPSNRYNRRYGSNQNTSWRNQKVDDTKRKRKTRTSSSSSSEFDYKYDY